MRQKTTKPTRTRNGNSRIDRRHIRDPSIGMKSRRQANASALNLYTCHPRRSRPHTRNPITHPLLQRLQRRIQLPPLRIPSFVRSHIRRIRLNPLRHLNRRRARLIQIGPMPRTHPSHQRAPERSALFRRQHLYSMPINPSLNLSPQWPSRPAAAEPNLRHRNAQLSKQAERVLKRVGYPFQHLPSQNARPYAPSKSPQTPPLPPGPECGVRSPSRYGAHSSPSLPHAGTVAAQAVSAS